VGYVNPAGRLDLSLGGLIIMDSFSADVESGVESELIDLGAVSLTVLRELDDTVLRQALRHVMQQTAHPQVTTGNGDGSARIG
jgi:FXSXX-COOH protein